MDFRKMKSRLDGILKLILEALKLGHGYDDRGVVLLNHRSKVYLVSQEKQKIQQVAA